MSGGHYRPDGTEYRVREFADQVREEAGRRATEERATRIAFAKLLHRVADAMHEIDWCDSGDTSWNDRSMAALLSLVAPADRMDAARSVAEEAMESLRNEIDRSKRRLR